MCVCARLRSSRAIITSIYFYTSILLYKGTTFLVLFLNFAFIKCDTVFCIQCVLNNNNLAGLNSPVILLTHHTQQLLFHNFLQNIIKLLTTYLLRWLSNPKCVLASETTSRSTGRPNSRQLMACNSSRSTSTA